MKFSQRGQIAIEYMLLLVVAVAAATLLVKGLASKGDNPGVVTKKWIEIQKEIGKDVPDTCKGDGCSN